MGGFVRKMVIFNALQTSLSGGIGRYSYELSKAIYSLQQIDFKIVIREEDKELFSFAKNEDLIIVKGIKNSKDRNYYEQFVLSPKIYKKFPDAIIHYPDSMAPLLAKNKVVITVHDLAFKSVKGAFTWKTTMWKNIMTSLSVKKADKIIAITNFAKTEIEKYYANISKDKITVVYNGFNDFSKESINLGNINKKILDLKNNKYILTVSTISPRKNIDGLIKAFKLIKDEIDYNLVIAGKNGWLYENVLNLVDELKLNDRIIFTGGINDDELKYLYKNTELFVYPSFYEGFGLPPLEAMSFGIPCIVSNVTSMPEVLGDKCNYFNPSDINGMSEEILRSVSKIVNNKIYKKNNYSWENCAKEVIKLY